MRWLGTLGFGALCAGAAAFAVREGAAPRRPPESAAAEPRCDRPEGGARVRVSEDFVRRFGVQTGRITTRALAPALELAGSVDFDPDHVADVGARIRGRVTRVLVGAGDAVEIGTPLVEIESASLGDVLASRTSAQAQAAAARARLAREADLFRQRLTTARAVEDARADLARVEAEAAGAGPRLAAMGAGAGVGRHVVLRAPIAGRVIRRDAIVGQTVDDTSTVMRIADLARVWVLLDAYEMDLAQVRVGDRAEITARAVEGPPLAGEVSHVDATIDVRTRAARVRVEVPNPELRLRPGQFVTARVRSAALGVREVTAVPRTAVVQIEGRPAVFVVRGAQEFEAAAVSLGEADGDNVEVTLGLRPGDQVVTEGAFALKSEMLR
jgi:cobalt-zinc-cadmium efflux system membrane fusion protein